MANTKDEYDLFELKAVQSESGQKKKRNMKKMDPVSKVILIISVIVFIGSGGYLLYKYFGEPVLEQMELASYKKDYQSEEPSTAEDGVWNNDDTPKEEERLPDGTLASFQAIRELNGDVVGWITVPNTLIYERSEWIIFANFRATASWATGTPFNYIRSDFADDKDFLQFVKDIQKRSLITTPVDVRADDKILLLSTCSYEKNNWRMVIAARRVRADESKIDVSSTVKAKNPLMP